MFVCLVCCCVSASGVCTTRSTRQEIPAAAKKPEESAGGCIFEKIAQTAEAAQFTDRKKLLGSSKVREKRS
jgi:hypothetical protein